MKATAQTYKPVVAALEVVALERVGNIQAGNRTPCHINCDAVFDVRQPENAQQMTFAYPYGKWLTVAYPINKKWFPPSKAKITIFSSRIPSLVSEINHVNYTSIGQLTKETTNSKGNLISTVYIYPIDVSLTSALVQTTKSKNPYGLPPGTFQLKNNSTELKLQQFAYNLTSNGDINLKTAQSSRHSSPLFNDEANMGSDNRNNILDLVQEGSHTLFIWDHNQSLQIVKVQNADQTSVANISFEGDGFGNLVGVRASSLVISSITHTGSKYLPGSFSFRKMNLLDGRYIGSYLNKNGTYTVNNTSAVKVLNTNDGCTCHQYVVTDPANSTITFITSGPVDELCLYCKAAMMKTITYLSLIEPDSITDQSNRPLYYEHDEYG